MYVYTHTSCYIRYILYKYSRLPLRFPHLVSHVSLDSVSRVCSRSLTLTRLLVVKLRTSYTNAHTFALKPKLIKYNILCKFIDCIFTSDI